MQLCKAFSHLGVVIEKRKRFTFGINFLRNHVNSIAVNWALTHLPFDYDSSGMIQECTYQHLVWFCVIILKILILFCHLWAVF